MRWAHLETISKLNQLITFPGFRSEVTMLKKREREISVSEKLSSLIQTKPSTIESDDEDLMTVSKIALSENESEYSADELEIPKFRQLNQQLLEDDKKYSGKGISRRELDSFIDNESSDAEESEAPGDKKTHSETASESLSDHYMEEDEEETGLEAETQHFDDRVNDELKLKNNKLESGNFCNEILLKAASDIEKGRAIRNQLYIWDFILECRLKFQKCLVASNQFPSFKQFPKFKSRGDLLFQVSVVQCKKSLKLLLNSLLNLQDNLLKSNNDFRKSITPDFNDISSNDVNEESFSDSDKDESYGSNTKISKKSFKKLNNISEKIGKRHASFQSYRNNTIQKWNDRTRIGYISNKNFSAFEQSTLKQIEHVLLDKPRLIKRTQTKRTSYHILGEEDTEPPLKKCTKQADDCLITSFYNKCKGFHKEIFDDDDFYHQLLSEMVKRKANDVTDPVQLGKQWMQLQKMRSKMKKTVDTKASKGRKVRFVVHPKLVNFMMPINNSYHSEESRTELFNSLFGKSKK